MVGYAHKRIYTVRRSPEDTYSLYLMKNDDETLTVSGYREYAAVETIDGLIIPEGVEGKAVIAIGSRAFSGIGVFSGWLILPEGLLYIGDSASLCVYRQTESD